MPKAALVDRERPGVAAEKLLAGRCGGKSARGLLARRPAACREWRKARGLARRPDGCIPRKRLPRTNHARAARAKHGRIRDLRVVAFAFAPVAPLVLTLPLQRRRLAGSFDRASSSGAQEYFSRLGCRVATFLATAKNTLVTHSTSAPIALGEWCLRLLPFSPTHTVVSIEN